MEYKKFMEALKGNQHKLDKNKNGKLDAHDFKLLRKEEEELDEADVQARADYKLDKSGRKYHKQIHFKDGSNDEANEKNEVREATQYGLPSHSHAHVMKKIKSGDWEATHDIKAGRHLEIIDHSKGGKRKTIHVKEEFNVNEEMTDAQKAERERLVKGMKKNLAGFKAKYGERAKEVMYATATKQAMKEEAESLEEESGQHKVVVTVSDPNHPAVSQRKEQIMKRVIVKADHKDGAVAKAKEFYKKKGYKVHDAEYHSPQPKSTMKTEETNVEEGYVVRYHNPKSELEEQAPVAPSLVKHRIGVTVSDPNATSVTARKEKVQKFVRVTHSDNKEGAQKVGEKHFKKKGYVVHDSWHAGMVNEEVELDESVGFDEEGNLMAEKLTYAQFMEQLLEYTPGPGGVTRVQGRSYGAQYHDPEGDDDADDKPKKKAEPAVKRGRGRPAGSKSGANQKVTSGKSYGGIATHSLHLPSSNR